jgi:hypothetical protein
MVTDSVDWRISLRDGAHLRNGARREADALCVSHDGIAEVSPHVSMLSLAPHRRESLVGSRSPHLRLS